MTLWLDDHEVHVQGLGRGAPHRFDDDGTEANRRYEAPVHHVDMDPVCARGIDRTHLFGEAAEVGRQDRRGDDERPHGAL